MPSSSSSARSRAASSTNTACRGSSKQDAVQRTLLVLASLVAASAAADPAVVRDGRLLDIAITPTLGRGYSPSVNSLHGVCFDSFNVTSPSFDFDYTFEDVESDRTANA